MDIKQAKDEIRRAVLAYTERDALGALRIPMVRQRSLVSTATRSLILI